MLVMHLLAVDDIADMRSQRRGVKVLSRLFVPRQAATPIPNKSRLYPKRDPNDEGSGTLRMKRPRKIVRRNPEARELLRNPLYRAKAMKSVKLQAARADHWDRRAKHKSRIPTERDPA